MLAVKPAVSVHRTVARWPDREADSRFLREGLLQVTPRLGQRHMPVSH